MRKVSANESDEDGHDEEETDADESTGKKPKPQVTKLLFDHEFVSHLKKICQSVGSSRKANKRMSKK